MYDVLVDNVDPPLGSRKVGRTQVRLKYACIFEVIVYLGFMVAASMVDRDVAEIDVDGVWSEARVKRVVGGTAYGDLSSHENPKPRLVSRGWGGHFGFYLGPLWGSTWGPFRHRFDIVFDIVLTPYHSPDSRA